MKIILDKLLAIILLLLLSPIFLFFSIWIKLDSQGSVFYKQTRITQYGKKFSIFKFRTMVENADKIGALVTSNNDQRITRVGKIIRKYRIDEIPQLINVVFGEMTFVGTRPEVEKYVLQYSDEMLATLLLPAGITSLASINFRNEEDLLEQYIKTGMSIEEAYVKKILPEKMQYNLQYIETFSISTDIKIMIDTFFKVLK